MREILTETMAGKSSTPVLDLVQFPPDLRRFDDATLCQLADELRYETIQAVSKTGGHLGSGLGVVELTLAIHAVFNTPDDKLIFDVGHQCYPHKILTGRRAQMDTLRKIDGLSGFTKRSESIYDPFGAAHSSTAMSAGLGFVTASQLSKKPAEKQQDAICVVGDSAMTGGMAIEALNNIGALKSRIFVILNDNGMSIAPAVGALHHHLQDLRAGKISKDNNLFTSFGFDYHGPVDGHDLPALLALLRDQRDNATGPVLIHAVTRKGAGFDAAEQSDCKYHGVGAFCATTGEKEPAKPSAPSYTSVFAKALIAEAESDASIVAITAGMPDGTGLDEFGKAFPDRMFDAGIAEQHAVTFAAGLAAAGMKPFCAIYSTFLQRAYDQIVHDVALQGLPVRFAIDRAGLVGADGPTHAGTFDIAYLSNLPGFTVMAAADEAELMDMIATCAAHNDGPSSVRYPRGSGLGLELPDRGTPLEIGRGRMITQGHDVAILSLGSALSSCREAAHILGDHGISPSLADGRFAKPLDTDLIDHLVQTHSLILTVEEGATGGFGALVMQYLAKSGQLDGRVQVHNLTLPDRFIAQGTPTSMLADAALDGAHIAQFTLDNFITKTAMMHALRSFDVVSSAR